MRLRLVALALSLPRSSYFKSYEVFVAEMPVSHEEWSPIKLVFYFLPYEPKLSESGLITWWSMKSQRRAMKSATRRWNR